MKSFHKELWFEIPTRMDFINISENVQSAVTDSGIRHAHYCIGIHQ